MLNRAVAGLVTSALLVLGACTPDAKPGPKRSAQMPEVTATVQPPRDDVDQSTRKKAQKSLDAALDRLLDDNSGEYASYVNFSGHAIKVEGRFDLIKRELEAVTLFSPPSGSGKATGVKSRVTGREIFGGPNAGPYRRCWFHYAGGAIEKLLPGDLPFEEDLAAVPISLALATDAKAIGSLRSDPYQIRVRVSAQTALMALNPQFVGSVIDKLPKKDLRTEATITVFQGIYTNVTIRADDVAETYAKKGVDLFDGDLKDFEEIFRSGTQTTSFRKYGTEVSVSRPPAETLVEVKGPDEIEGNPLCAAISS